jgi:hypothetical protein
MQYQELLTFKIKKIHWFGSSFNNKDVFYLNYYYVPSVYFIAVNFYSYLNYPSCQTRLDSFFYFIFRNPLLPWLFIAESLYSDLDWFNEWLFVIYCPKNSVYWH